MSTESASTEAASNTSKKPSPLPRAVVVLGFVSLLTDSSSEMIMPLMPALLMGTLGGSTFVLGFIDGLADALSAILKLVAGRLSDKSPQKKPFVLAGYGLSTLVRPLVGLAMAPWHIVAVRGVDRLGKGIRSAPRDAILASSVDAADSERAFGFHRAMDHAGAVVGPLLASAALAVGFQVRTTILLAWIPGLAALLTLLIFLRETPATTAPATTTTTMVKTPKKALPPKLRGLLVLMGAFSLVVVADLFLLVRASELGVSPAVLPLVWVGLHFVKVIAASQVTRVPLRGAAAVAAAWGLLAVGFTLAAVDNVWVFVVAVALIALGHGGREPSEKALVRRLSDKDGYGSAFGAYGLTTGIAALPAGLWIGGLWSLADGPWPGGGPTTLLVAAAATGLMAAALFASRRLVEP